MKNKVLKAMACLMSVCMLSTSLAGCGNDDSGQSSTPSSDSQPSSSTQESESSGGADDASTPDDGAGDAADIGADQSNGLYPAYDFGGVELTVLKYNDLGNLDPDSEDLLPNDEDDDAAAADKALKKAERQEKKDYIEAKYNVKLTFVGLPTNDWAEIPSQLVMNYTSGNPDADIMDIYFQHIGTLINNGMIYDFTNDMDGRFGENALFNWSGKSYGVGSYMSGEGLYYNKDMIKELGMEYTPAEMFAMGQWSYDDFFNYLQELQSLMGEDDYPLFVDTLYWTIFAPMANGGQSLFGDNGDLRYLSETGLETMEEYAKLVDAKLIPINAVYDEETGELKGYDTWNYPGNTFDQGEHVAIAHRAAWQADGCKSKFDLGFVPYPWGSGTTVDSSKVGQMDAYLTLENYKQACFDGQTVCLTNGIEKKAEPIQVLSMVLEWMGWDWQMAAYQAPEGEVRTCNWLDSETLDSDLYFWSQDRTIVDNWYMLIKFKAINWFDTEEVYYGGGSLRSSLESAYNADMQSLIDAGYTTADVWSADFEMHDVETEEEGEGEGEGQE